MVDIFDEAKEDLKEERTWRLIKKVVPIAATLSVIIIIAVSFYVWQRNRNTSHIEAVSIEFDKAIEYLSQDKAQDALNQFLVVMKQNNKNYSSMAGLRAASILVEQKKLDKALQIYKDIAESKNADSTFIDTAKLLYVSLSMGKSSDEDLYKRLDDIIDSDGYNQYIALEFKGTLHFKDKQYKKAKESFSIIFSSVDAPQALKKNAESMLALILNKIKSE